MKKAVMVFAGGIFLLLPWVLWGCGGGVSKGNHNQGGNQGEREVAYEIIEDPGHLCPEIQEVIGELKSRRGYYVFCPRDYLTGGNMVLLVSSGEKPTAGYNLGLESIKGEGQSLEVFLEEEGPSAGDITAQVITYPHLIIEIGGSYADFQVLNTRDQAFTKLTREPLGNKDWNTGIYRGQVDSSFVEVEIMGESREYMFPWELSWLFAHYLEPGQEMTLAFYENQYGQMVITGIQEEKEHGITGKEGFYGGQIDQNFIEIEVESVPQSFMLTEFVDIDYLETGDRVLFDYYQDPYNQRVIYRIEKQ